MKTAKIYNFRTPPDPASQIWGLQTQIWVQESPRSGQKSGKSGSEILGSGILGSWDLRSWDLGSWGPGILGSWDPGILGSWDLGSWGLGSWDTENSKLPKSLTSLMIDYQLLCPPTVWVRDSLPIASEPTWIFILGLPMNCPVSDVHASVCHETSHTPRAGPRQLVCEISSQTYRRAELPETLEPRK